MKRLILITLCCLLCIQSKAQSLVDKIYEIKVIDSLEGRLPLVESNQKLDLLNTLAEAYWFQNPDMTLKYAHEALSLSTQLSNQEGEGYALINLCQGYLLKDIYDKALEYGLKALKVRQQLDNQEDIAYTLRTLGWLYYDIQDTGLAHQYHQQVLEIHQGMNDSEKIAYSHNSLGLVYTQKGEHEEAIKYFLKALHSNELLNKPDRVSENLKNIGISYSAMDNYEVAMNYLLRARALFVKANDNYRLAEVYNELALVYTRLNKIGLASNTLQTVNPIIVQLSDNQELKMRFHQASSEYHEKIGDYHRALNDIQDYAQINNQILSKEQNHRLAEMRVTFEAEKRQGEIKILAKEKELADLKRRGWMIGIIFVVVIAVLVVTRMRSSFRKRRAIFRANQALATERLRNEQLIQKNLKNELQFKSQELVNFGLHISQKNELYIDFIKQLQKLEFLNKYDTRQKIRNLIKYFNQKLKFNEVLDAYETNPQHLNDDFFYRLQAKFPNLTDNDRRLAAQLRSKLTSKEISSMNNISVKSVEISRYRLRKKLNLEKGKNLVTFIQQI